jgi:hypothetical protein
VKNVKELGARQRGGQLNYASGGVGSAQHPDGNAEIMTGINIARVGQGSHTPSTMSWQGRCR